MGDLKEKKKEKKKQTNKKKTKMILGKVITNQNRAVFK